MTTRFLALFATQAAMISMSVTVLAVDRQLSQIDQASLIKFAQANQAEIRLGNMAIQKGLNPAVKDFGKRMVTDHTAMQKDVKNFTDKVGLPLLSDISAEDHATMNKLQGLSGAKFDRQYMHAMLKDHRKDVSEQEKLYEKTKNPTLKSLIGKTLPILQNHLLVAENVAGQIGISPKLGLNRPEYMTG